MIRPPMRDRVRGMLVSGALGDSIGNGTVDAVFGALTDDTQLTCATCDAIVRARGVEPEALAAEYLDWYRNGRLHGLGAATLEALQGLAAGGHWALVGRTGEYAAGNGAAMRMAPLGLVLDVCDNDDRRLVRDVARITHRNEEAYAAAMAVVAGVQFGVENLIAVANAVPDSVTRDRLRRLQRDRPVTVDDAMRMTGTSGWAADTVPLAFGCALLALQNGLVEIFAELGRHDGDLDTIGSIAGQLYGAACGMQSLTVDDLPGHREVQDTATRFAAWLATSARSDP